MTLLDPGTACRKSYHSSLWTDGDFCHRAGLPGPQNNLKPHCIQCSHFKVDDVSALEASSNQSVRIVEDNVTASATYAMTLVTAWMP
jgi:hypothetical protein